MSYTRIQRYQRLSPDLQTEWGTFTNPHMLSHPSQMKYRQPAVPLLATGRSDVIHPRAMGPQGLGYVGDYVPGPMGESPPPTQLGDIINIKNILILAGIAFVIYLLVRSGKPKSNPCVADVASALEQMGYPAPGGGMPAAAPRRRGRQTRAGKKSLSRYARGRARDASGKFI